MNKNFDEWNIFKKYLDKNESREVYAYPREVWWCSLGLNIGSEIDGKNESFERPVLVMRVYNKDTILILPITSKIKDDKFHFKIQISSKDLKTGIENNRDVWIKLTQVRVISNKRLLRKVDTIKESDFQKINNKFKEFI